MSGRLDLPGNAFYFGRVGAAEIWRRLSRRETTAEKAVQDCLDRIAERERVVQAWEVVGAEGALREARRIDALSARPLLCGLPVGIKDIIDTADLPTGYGSPRHQGHRPALDAECVRILRAAGAVVLGKTVTTEFAVYHPGGTRNPRDPARTPGGSSSGSAAAVADGMVPFALGTQTAASVIRPASFCGVVGWKPAFGWASLDGVHPLAPSLDTLGFFVPEVADVPLVLAAFAGAQPRPLETRIPKLALCRTELWDRAEPSTRTAVEKAAGRLAQAGADVRELKLPDSFDELVGAQIAIMGAEAAVALSGEHEVSPKLREFLDAGARVTTERLAAARAHAARCRGELDALVAPFDALLTPAAAGEAPLGLSSTGNPAFSRIWTLLGNPCASLPALHGPSGMPLGLQLVGRHGADDSLLGAAAFVAERL